MAGKERHTGIELLRIISMFFALMLHTLSHGGIFGHVDWMSGRYLTGWFMEAAAFCSVDCFALISGYVGVESGFRWSRLFSLWLQVLFYSLIFTALAQIFVPEVVNWRTWADNLFPITTGQYWYVTAYAGMFIFIPVMNMALNRLEGRTVALCMTAALLLFSVLPSIFGQDSPYLGLEKGGYSSMWLCLMYMLGGCIKKYELARYISRKRAVPIFLACTLIAWASKIIIERADVEKYGYSLGNNGLISYISPFIIINAVALLCFFVHTELGEGFGKKLVLAFAPAAFGVYLIHDNYLMRYMFMDGIATPLAYRQSVVMAAGIVGLDMAIYTACSLIEKLRIWLFRLIGVPKLCRKLDDKITGGKRPDPV